MVQRKPHPGDFPREEGCSLQDEEQSPESFLVSCERFLLLQESRVRCSGGRHHACLACWEKLFCSFWVLYNNISAV